MTHFRVSKAGCITLVSTLISAGACGSSASEPASPALENTATGGVPAVVSSAGSSAAGSSANSPVSAQPSGMKAPTSPNDAESAAAAASTCNGPAPVMKMLDKMNGGIVAPDWSCLTAPPNGASASASASTQALRFKLRSLTPQDIQGVQVDFFLSPSTLGQPHASKTFDGQSDLVSIDVPGGQTSLTVKINGLQRDDMTRSIAELREYDLPVMTSDEPVQGFMLLTAQRKLIVNEALKNQDIRDDDPAKAFLVSYARDCSGHDVSGAQFELLDDSGAVVQSGAAEGLPHTSYMQFAIPNPECTYTSFDQSAWVMINAPVNASETGKAKTYRLRVKGRLVETDPEPVLFGQADVEMVAGAITFVHLAPKKL